MLKFLFSRKSNSNWEVAVKCGVMVRTCKRTGEKEYRDTKTRAWIPFVTLDELDVLHKSATELPAI